MIIWVNLVLNRTVVVDSDWCLNNLCGSHLQSQSELYHVRGTSETIACILQPYNIHVAHKPITTLWQLLTNVKEKDKPEDRQGAVYQIKCCNCQATYIGETGRNLSMRQTKQTIDEKWWRQQSHCWTPFADNTSNRLRLCGMYYVFYRLLSMTHYRKLVY